MGLRDDVIALLSPPYHVLPVNADGTYLITRHGDRALDPPVRLELSSEIVFEQYVARLAAEADEPDASAALGLVYVHIDEEITADTSLAPVVELGVQARRIGRPSWFIRRAPVGHRGEPASALWLPDPPKS